MTTIEIGTVSVSDGVAEKEYTIPSNFKVGESTIRAVYIQNDHYQTAQSTGTATIKRPTAITVENVLGSKGQVGTFTATVIDAINQTTVTDGTVQFQWKGTNFGSPVTATNGEFVLEQLVPTDAETGDEITAVYQGTSIYSSSTTTTAGILTIRGEINITVQTLSANRGTTPTIIATATDGNGDPITVGQATLKIDGTQSGSSVMINSTDGTFSFTSYTVPQEAPVGSHTITVEYAQNDNYDAKTGVGSLIVRTPVTLSPVNTSVNPGETAAPIQVTVKDHNNHDVTEGSVQITIGSESAVTAVVSNGLATVNYNVPANASGTITVSAIYVENPNYQGATMATNGIITVRQSVNVQVSDVTANLSDTVTLEATVKSGNTNVDEGQLTFTIDE